jgi:hypothetical protein
MKNQHAISYCLAVVLLIAPTGSLGQSVSVTLRLETNQLAVGQSTVLHVYGQVVPALRTNADRIFSWYLDLMNSNGLAVAADFTSLSKPASDNLSQISSNGFSQGANRRGIYDTFLFLPGAGVTNPVELVRVPIVALAAGQTRFSAAAGTGVPSLSSDFLVSPLNGGDPWSGGDYSATVADLQVGAATCQPRLQLAPLSGRRLQLTFAPCPNYDNFVEFATALSNAPAWQPLPGGPFNSGSVVVSNLTAQTFFRVRLSSPSPAVKLFAAPLAGSRLQLTFTPQASYDHYLDFASSFGSPTAWQPYAGGPFNGGFVVVSNTVAKAFFRLRLQHQ